MHAELKVVAALLAVLATSVSATPAQRLRPPGPKDGSGNEQSAGRQLERPVTPDLNKNPMLLEAAKTPPAPADSLARLIPEKLGAFSRKKVDAQVKQIGPALYSEVRAQLQGKGAQQGSLLLVDTGGLPPEAAPPVLDVVVQGGREEKGGLVREAFEAGGYPGVCEDPGPKMTRRVQVEVSKRVRLTLESSQASCADLITSAKAIDLKAVDSLAGGEAPEK